MVVPLSVFPWLLLLLLSGCSHHHLSRQSPNAHFSPPKPYVRLCNINSNIAQLQIAIRQFLPTRSKGPAIWLTAVSHIADSSYYTTLQEHLDAQSLVLFEGVSGAAPSPANKTAEAIPPSATVEVVPHPQPAGSLLQSSLASSLGLVFQLEAIDYQRPNFRNSDLTVPELRQLLAGYETQPGKTGPGESFEDVLQMMEGSSFLNSLLQLALRFLSASPKL